MHCVLGLDPGIGRTGYAFITKKDNSLNPIAFGCIETSTAHTTEQRFLDLFNTITALIKKYKPEVCALEQLFFNTNQKTVITIGQAQGVLLLAAAQAKLPVVFLTPPQIKMAVTGYGHAGKEQVGRMMQTYLTLPSIPTPDDTADALACALAYLYTTPFT